MRCFVFFDIPESTTHALFPRRSLAWTKLGGTLLATDMNPRPRPRPRPLSAKGNTQPSRLCPFAAPAPSKPGYPPVEPCLSRRPPGILVSHPSGFRGHVMAPQRTDAQRESSTCRRLSFLVSRFSFLFSPAFAPENVLRIPSLRPW